MSDAQRDRSDCVPDALQGRSAAIGPPALPARSAEPRWRIYVCFFLMLAAIQITIGPKVQLSQWTIDARQNAGIAEGEAWLHGRLDLPATRDTAHDRPHDTAYFNGKIYNV